ncbi:hypothetical protein H706_00192, partial [Bartonella bacilliformis CAR600-02]
QIFVKFVNISYLFLDACYVPYLFNFFIKLFSEVSEKQKTAIRYPLL